MAQFLPAPRVIHVDTRGAIILSEESPEVRLVAFTEAIMLTGTAHCPRLEIVVAFISQITTKLSPTLLSMYVHFYM